MFSVTCDFMIRFKVKSAEQALPSGALLPSGACRHNLASFLKFGRSAIS